MNRLFTALLVALLLVCTLSAQVSVAPAEYPKLQFMNRTGTGPCSACTITTYTGGTTNLLPTYTDSTGTSTNPNPLTLDSSGFPPSQIWFGPSTYKMVLKDATNVVIWTVDNIKSLTQITSAFPTLTGINSFSGANTFTAKITASGGITGLPAPSATSDATTKSYVDGLSVSLSSPTPIGSVAPNTGSFTNLKVVDATYDTAFRAIGDSITNCHGIVTQANCFVDRIAAAKNWTLTRQGVDGDGIPDMSARTFANSVSTSNITTFLCCVNDMRNNGSGAAGTLSTAQRVTWQATVQANVLAAGLPDIQKTYGDTHGANVPAVSYGGGAWSSAGQLGGHLFRTSSAAATATVSVYGSTIYVLSAWQLGNTSTYKITIDGVDQAFTINGVTGTTLSTATGAYTTFNSTTFGPYAYRIPGLAKTNHTVVLTCVSADGLDPCYFLMAATNNGAATQAGPFVYFGDTIRFNTGGGIGYAANGGSDAAVSAHNLLAREVLSDLAADGLNAVYVGVDSLGATGYFPNGVNDQADGVHPSDIGDGLVASSFLAEMSGLAIPRERGISKAFENLGLRRSGNALQYIGPLGILNFPTATGTVGDVIASGTSTFTTTAVLAGACQTTVTTAATGALTTDTISWAYSTAPTAATDGMLTIQPYLTANNVNFMRCNPTAGSITPTALVINWKVGR